MQDPSTDEFWKRHGITSPLYSSLAEPAIVALDSAHRIFAAAFNEAPEPKETSGMIRCAFENLSNRLYEQAAGMVVCLGTGSAAAAETLARTVIEAAFNLQFMASKDHEARLFAFFYQYLKEHERKLRDWKHLEFAKSKTASQMAILKAISDHESALQRMFEFVKDLGKGVGFEQPETVSQYWPSSLFKRCEEMDKAGDYLTSYHRLSASSHVNAEETIRWLFGICHSAIGPYKRLTEKLRLETVSYTAMMTRIAVAHYIEANAVTCRALDADYDRVPIGKTLKQLSQSIDDIASAAGSAIA